MSGNSGLSWGPSDPEKSTWSPTPIRPGTLTDWDARSTDDERVSITTPKAARANLSILASPPTGLPTCVRTNPPAGGTAPGIPTPGPSRTASAAAATVAPLASSSAGPTTVQHIINTGWEHPIYMTTDDPEVAETVIAGASQQDPSNRDIMAILLAAMSSLQLQVTTLTEHVGDNTSGIKSLALDLDRVKHSIRSLNTQVGRPNHFQQVQTAAAAHPPQQQLNRPILKLAQQQQQAPQQKQQQQQAPCPKPGPSSDQRIQADGWVEVIRKGKDKPIAQAAAGSVAAPPPAQVPKQMKIYPRKERDLVIPADPSSQQDITPTLPKLHATITKDLAKCGNLRPALPIEVRLSKKGAIVITTAPHAPASSIKANIEALLPQISAITGTNCTSIGGCNSGIFFLIHAVPTFERETTKTEDQHEAEYLNALELQIEANTAVGPTSVQFLRNREHRNASKSQGTFVAIVAVFPSEPTFPAPGHMPAEKTRWRIYNKSCKVERMHPNHRNSICKNCLQFGHPTEVCMENEKLTKCAYCGENHMYSDHTCKTPGCNDKAPCRHTVLNCALCNTQGDHHTFDKNCPTWKARNPPRPREGD